MEYKLLGTVNVPEEKKAELNEYVLAALYRGGIRKTCEVVLDGNVYTTVKTAIPDENGIVFFDYSIFERIKREPGQYNIMDCSLQVHDRQNNEYGLVMNMIMFLQEIYSESMCLLMADEVPIPYPNGYRKLIKGLLGVEFYPEKRTKPRDMLHFLRENGIGEIKLEHIIDGMVDDWFCDREQAKKEIGIIEFFRVLLRKNENEFLEYWDGNNLILSDNMQKYIADWKDWFDSVPIPEDLNMEKELARIAQDLQDSGNAYMDYAFVEEFMAHQDQDDYKKAIQLFKKTKEKDCKLFPELTAAQAYEWMIKPNRNAEDKIAGRAYQALLVNRGQRKNIFGF